jgi:CheY-like chemotaxis protein
MGRGAGIRVLCVDDNRDVAESLTMLLDLVGFDARACFDGHTALAEAATFRPHVGVLDINMPGMNGYELARRLRDQQGPHLFLMAITATGDPDADHRAIEAGFNLQLTTPADPTQVLAALTRIRTTRAL